MVIITTKKDAVLINFTLDQKFHLAKQLGAALLAENATVATVESCTGGGIAHAITEIAGSSQWFNQSWVSYSNQAKQTLVNVCAQSLQTHGAVSESVVKQMAENGAKLAQADYCLAVSGIAGPGGGTDDKPVGLVWFAICTPKLTRSFNRRFSGDRKLVREQAITLGLEKLIQCIGE